MLPISLNPSEIKFTFTTSPGPGGQNVNKVATAVQLRFNVLHSPSLPEAVLNGSAEQSRAVGEVSTIEDYKLRLLEQDIQDNAANATRFLVLGRQCSPPTGDDRTSLMISVADKAGALHQAIDAFRRFKINLTKIESRPSKRKAWEYFFFIDCAGHYQDAKVAKAIKLLGAHCNFVKILGSYPNVD